MENRNYYENENEYDWDDQYYGTGNTEPPKQRSGAMALMLILVIFLFGIITVLGILNIRLFQELKLKKRKRSFPSPLSRKLPCRRKLWK